MMRATALLFVSLPLSTFVFGAESLTATFSSACSTAGDAAALTIAAVVLAIAHGKELRRRGQDRRSAP